jgi:hypothetical protein
MEKTLAGIVLVVILALSLVGCKATESDLKLAVHIGTGIYAQNHPDKAASIAASLKFARAGIASGVLSDVSSIKTALIAQLADFTPEDLVVIDDLMGSIEGSVETLFADQGITDPKDQLVEVNKVLGWALDILSPGGTK